jgi:hypothetical protein
MLLGGDLDLGVRVVVEPRPQVRQDLLSAPVRSRDQENVAEAILVLPISRSERHLYIRIGPGHSGLFHPGGLSGCTATFPDAGWPSSASNQVLGPETEPDLVSGVVQRIRIVAWAQITTCSAHRREWHMINSAPTASSWVNSLNQRSRRSANPVVELLNALPRTKASERDEPGLGVDRARLRARHRPAD